MTIGSTVEVGAGDEAAGAGDEAAGAGDEAAGAGVGAGADAAAGGAGATGAGAGCALWASAGSLKDTVPIASTSTLSAAFECRTRAHEIPERTTKE
jgi:hypothetical protein